MAGKIKKKTPELDKIERGVKLILEGVGENPQRSGLKDTPKRVARMFSEILGGVNEDPARHLRVIQGEKHDEMVLIKNIPCIRCVNIISFLLPESRISLTSPKEVGLWG